MYTLIAQDDLNTLGFSTGGLDGIFGANTENAVKRYQTSRGLASDRYCRLQYLAFSSRKCCWYTEELQQRLINLFMIHKKIYPMGRYFFKCLFYWVHYYYLQQLQSFSISYNYYILYLISLIYISSIVYFSYINIYFIR